ncbi:hypothetical protein DFH28DRAFT_902374 [Melampsora americana]|nr:hypothetical protein DFH28DRAFT_902374 [Melampsora americana]
MLLIDLVAKLSKSYPDTLSTLTVSQLANFTTLSAEFIHRTDGVYGQSPHEAPIEFLTHCLDPAQTMATWARLWNVLYYHLPDCAYDTKHFEKNGIPFIHRPKDALIIPQRTFNPPTKHCLFCTTESHGDPITLDIRTQVCGYLFDIGCIESVQSFSGYCRKCKVTYRPCYLRRGDVREYYTLEEGHPKEFFQVTRHYFMTHRLADHLNHLQAIGVVGIYNLVIIYNQAHANISKSYPNDFRQSRYTRRISHHVMSLALDLFRLMQTFHARGVRLFTDAKGTDDRRFHWAMKQHLMWLELEGSPFANHVCSICTAIEPIPNSDEATSMFAFQFLKSNNRSDFVLILQLFSHACSSY